MATRIFDVEARGFSRRLQMCCATGRLALLTSCLLLSSCREPSASPKATSDHAHAEDAAVGDQRRAKTAISVRIEFSAGGSAPTIEYDTPVSVVLANNTDKPIRIWNPETKQGYSAFSFNFTDPRSGKAYIARRRHVDDDGYWQSLSQRIRSAAEVIELPSLESVSFEFTLSEFAWGDRAWTGLPSPNGDDPYSVAVEFANADGSQKVWTGSIQSEPMEVRFVADRFKTPHDYLWNGFAEKAIEMMEADPKLVAARDRDQCTPLHHAARFGPAAAVEWLLGHGADVNAKAYNQFTPLHLASDPNVIRQILQGHPDLTLRDASDLTARQRAASEVADARDEKIREQWRQILKLYEDAAGESDLFTAATVGDVDRVKVILTQLPELADDFQGRSPLRIAASRGHFEICQYLLDGYRVDVNDFERGVGYPIIKEALAYPKIVRLLIEHGADLKKRITWQGGRSGVWIIGDNATALHYAADNGVPETINLLIDNGVDIFAMADDVTDAKDQQTALEVASFFGRAENAQAIVVHPKFDATDGRTRRAVLDKCLLIGASPSWLARDADRPKLMDVLISKGANPNTSEDGITPIQAAASEIHPTHAKENEEIKRTIAVLTRHGGRMDLFSAVALGDETQVERLLKDDPHLANARAPDGYPALHLAVAMDYRKIVALLLKAGGDVNISNQSKTTGTVGETALDCADFWERDEVAKILVASGGKHQAD